MNILNELMGPADAGVSSMAPAATADDPTRKPLMVLRAIVNGQLPGVLVPKNAPPLGGDFTAEDLASSGVGLYQPQTPELAVVLHNAEQVPVEKLQELDASGHLLEALPSITDFIGGAKPETDVPAVEGGNPAPVPILPRPTMGGDAQHQAAATRLKRLTGNEPSKRPIPGGGQILNALVTRAV